MKDDFVNEVEVNLMANKVAVITGGVIRQFIESEVTRQKGIADNLTDDHIYVLPLQQRLL